MSLINTIENKIKELSGGEFQKLGDDFLAKKFPDYKLIALGSQEGTNKTTKGIPDTYLELPNGKQIFVMYGTHSNASKKIAEDIKSAKEKIEELGLGTEQIEKIICCHTSSNIGPEKKKKFEEEASPYELELIGINEIANTLCYNIGYQYIARDVLGVSESTDQVWDIESFIKIHDHSKTNAPISNDYLGGSVDNYVSLIESDVQVLLIADNAGVGKTRLGIEICKELEKKGYIVLCIKSNGQATYQDLKRFIDGGKDTVVFIDDVNLVSDYKSVISLLNIDEKLKFILTCRSYSRAMIEPHLKEYQYMEVSVKEMGLEGKEALIKQFSDDNIHSKTIQELIDAGQSNPRLLVLAAILSKKEKSKKYANRYEILRDYYDEILSSSEVDSGDLDVLFIVYFLNRLKYKDRKENVVYSKLADLLQVNDLDVEDRIKGLYKKELIDIHNEYICKIADQTLGDYVVIKFLITRENDIIHLFEILYSIDRNRFVEILAQSQTYYEDEQFWHAVQKGAATYYSKIAHDDYEAREEFLLSFGSLVPNETIKFVKLAMLQAGEEVLQVPISIEQISNKNNSVRDKLLRLLRTLIETGHIKIPLKLLFGYLSRKPSIIDQVFLLLVDCFNSLIENGGYYYFMGEVMKILCEANNLNIMSLSVVVYEDFLKLHRESAIFRENCVSHITCTFPDNEVLIGYREKIFENLNNIYKLGEAEHKKYTINLLLNYSEDIKKYLKTHSKMIKSDLAKIRSTFFCEMQNLSVLEEKTVYQLSEIANQIGSKDFEGYVVSERQKVYIIISSYSLAHPYKPKHKEKIVRIATEYEGEWEQFFVNLKLITDADEKLSANNVENVLYNLYKNLPFSEQCRFIQAMLKANYKPFRLHPFDFLREVSPLNYSDLLSFIPDLYKTEWLLATLVMAKEVTKEQYDSLIELLEDYSLPLYYSITSFLKFEEFCPGFLSKGILKSDSEYFWIPNLIREEEAKQIVKCVDYKTLEYLYLSNLSKTIDQTCTLLVLLSKHNPSFGVKVFKEMCKHEKYNGSRLDLIIYRLKKHDFFDEVILEFALYTIREGKGQFTFLKRLLEDRKDLIQELLNRALNEDEFIKVINLGSEFLEPNDMISAYKLMKERGYGSSTYMKLQFQKYFKIWSGSLIPELEKEITHLEMIKDIFSDEIDYIEMVDRLDELIEAKRGEISIEKEREF
ncbi:hypothetical protein [uncultured Abiotrophia sp.]|uniref:hypothetical protein n=1 Tax=uncultured Abiotrophia sp. TaxID=316094 RepID=UPI0028F039EF|nr:hypothetical protein [uncultured Abiotrophia sp.]